MLTHNPSLNIQSDKFYTHYTCPACEPMTCVMMFLKVVFCRSQRCLICSKAHQELNDLTLTHIVFLSTQEAEGFVSCVRMICACFPNHHPSLIMICFYAQIQLWKSLWKHLTLRRSVLVTSLLNNKCLFLLVKLPPEVSTRVFFTRMRTTPVYTFKINQPFKKVLILRHSVKEVKMLTVNDRPDEAVHLNPVHLKLCFTKNTRYVSRRSEMSVWFQSL